MTACFIIYSWFISLILYVYSNYSDTISLPDDVLIGDDLVGNVLIFDVLDIVVMGGAIPENMGGLPNKENALKLYPKQYVVSIIIYILYMHAHM